MNYRVLPGKKPIYPIPIDKNGRPRKEPDFSKYNGVFLTCEQTDEKLQYLKGYEIEKHGGAIELFYRIDNSIYVRWFLYDEVTRIN